MAKQFFRKLLLGAIGLAGMMTTPIVEAGVPIKFSAWGVHHGGQIVYRYQIENNSESIIHQVDIGVNSLGRELPGKPWSLNPNYTDIPVQLDASLCKPFVGMDCTIAVFQFDYMPEPKTNISMSGVENNLNPPPKVFSGAENIKPRSLSSIAELYMSPAYQSSGYLTASGEVYLLDNNTKDANGKVVTSVQIPFTKVDVAPPTLAVTLTPTTLPETDKLVPITATLTVADDYDPQPEIRLDSIAVNEVYEPDDIQDASLGTDDRQFLLKAEQEGKNPLGRIYTVQYSATDGSGNTSIATATVTVSRKKEDKEHKKEDSHKDTSHQEKQSDKDKPFWKFW